MTAPVLPQFQSMLSIPTQSNNFIALQSAKITAGVAAGSVTFTALPGTNRVTYKITNTSSTIGAYICGSNSGAIVSAVASTTTPQPTSGTAISTCDYIGPGAILQQDFLPLTDTISCITGSSTAVLEISIGVGQ